MASMAEGGESVALDIQKALEIQKKISQGLIILENSVSVLRGHLESPVNQSFVKQLLGENGTIPIMHHVQAGKQEFENSLRYLLEQVEYNNQQIRDLFKSAYGILKGLVNCLTLMVKEWQSQFQLFYSKLMAPPDLEKIASWCATVGKILHQLLHESFEVWNKILKTIPVNELVFQTELQRQQSDLRNLMISFMQSTFIVTEQADFSIRALKKKFPTMRIRVLAADYIYDQSEEVTVYLVSEPDLKQCFHDDNLDIETLKTKEIETVLENQMDLAIKSQKCTNKMECCCENLHFKEPFKRQKPKDMKVHEDKYRIVFVTEMESENFWTISLPLVVITASNQEIDGLASIMWQCTSTNVFSMKEETPAKMKWSTVAWMLKQKMSVISKSHNLTDDNIKHLKYRLFGEENISDDTLVSLTQFCSVPMRGLKEAKFTFWKWFLGIFNVIEDYLLPYWNDGLIMGFVKRTDAARMLMQCERSGTFILRFSDTELIDKDGLKNVHGLLKVSVLCIILKTTKKMGKRNSTGQRERTEKRIENVEYDHPLDNLANILEDEKKHLYCYLYGSDKPRKELFENHYKATEKEESTSLSEMYKKPSQVDPTIDDLKQAFRDISLINGLGSLPADNNLQSEPRIVKKPRSEEMMQFDERSINGQADISSYDLTQNNIPLYLVQKTCDEQSLGYSSTSLDNIDQSPTQYYVPNHTFHGNFTTELNQDAVVPETPDKHLLPKVIEDMDVLEPSSNNFCNRKNVCNISTYQTDLGKTTEGHTSPGEHFLSMIIPAVDTPSNQNIENISGSPDNVLKTGGDNAAIGDDIYALNERTGMAVHDANMVVEAACASSKEIYQYVNDVFVLQGGTSTHDRRDIQVLVDSASSEVGAGASVDVDGPTDPQGKATLVRNNDLSLGRGSLNLLPNQDDGQTFEKFDYYGYETRTSTIPAPQNQQVPNCLQVYSKLSHSTLTELKQTLKPDQFLQVLIWTQTETDKVETVMPVPNAVEFGEKHVDLGANSPCHQNEELSLGNATTFAEPENSLDGLLNTDLLNDEPVPVLQDFDKLFEEVDTTSRNRNMKD